MTKISIKQSNATQLIDLDRCVRYLHGLLDQGEQKAPVVLGWTGDKRKPNNRLRPDVLESDAGFPLYNIDEALFNGLLVHPRERIRLHSGKIAYLGDMLAEVTFQNGCDDGGTQGTVYETLAFDFKSFPLIAPIGVDKRLQRALEGVRLVVGAYDNGVGNRGQAHMFSYRQGLLFRRAYNQDPNFPNILKEQ